MARQRNEYLLSLPAKHSGKKRVIAETGAQQRRVTVPQFAVSAWGLNVVYSGCRGC